MKIFKIEASGYSHEDDIAIIIVAEDEKRANHMTGKTLINMIYIGNLKKISTR